MSYNGWTDRPTWALNLWWSNEHGLYTHLRDAIIEQLDNNEQAYGADADSEQAVDFAAALLEEDFREREAAIGDGMLRDMLPDPNFREVAKSWVDEEVLQRSKGAA
jgi:hypothetical protein